MKKIRNVSTAKSFIETIGRSGEWSLAMVLILPFALQIVSVVGLVGYLSYSNGQRAVEDITRQKMDAIGRRVEQKLASYLETPHLVNQMNSDAILRGSLNLNLERDDSQRDRYLWQQMQLFEERSYLDFFGCGGWRREYGDLATR